MRLEELQETKRLLLLEIYVKLKGIHAGTLSGVRSLISTSFDMLLARPAGLAAERVADDAFCDCIAASYAVATALILSTAGACIGAPSAVADSAMTVVSKLVKLKHKIYSISLRSRSSEKHAPVTTRLPSRARYLPQ